jgi:hypothetical protein
LSIFLVSFWLVMVIEFYFIDIIFCKLTRWLYIYIFFWHANAFSAIKQWGYVGWYVMEKPTLNRDINVILMLRFHYNTKSSQNWYASMMAKYNLCLAKRCGTPPMCNVGSQVTYKGWIFLLILKTLSIIFIGLETMLRGRSHKFTLLQEYLIFNLLSPTFLYMF